MKIIDKLLVNADNKQSTSNQLRRQRFSILLDMLKDIPRPVKILDIGGEEKYWNMMLGGTPLLQELEITLVNVKEQSVSLPNFTAIAGDARALPQFADKQFDIVFSNSTIEHVGDFKDRQRMANEVKRLGKRYYLQTPNRYFPIEPHFVFPFFQFLPISGRVWLLKNFELGTYPKIKDTKEALEAVKEINLITKKELRFLFPEARFFDEKYFGLVKSFVAYSKF
jgi:ubiquinone/menaquinone biosynthesis C-methylase UbiE